ncbi:MAG: ATP-binding protein [Chloroherpetonaceae bacterium]|nr:ATP-binding protein [Chloroherpetonaceae bacterium]
MTLKFRLYFGYALLALLVALTGGASLYVVSWLSNEPSEIIKANYQSIAYSEQMVDALDELTLNQLYPQNTQFTLSKQTFEKNLLLAENNITEVGEKETLDTLRNQYELLLQQNRNDSLSFVSTATAIRATLLSLRSLNESAMFQRIDRVKTRTRSAEFYIGLIILISFVVVIFGVWKITPLVIVPLNDLSDKISSISERKYSERLPEASRDELGKVARAFNQMAARLEEFERSNIEELTAAKKRAEAIVESIPDGVLVFSPNHTIILANRIASELIGLSKSELIGKNAADLSQTNNLISELLSKMNRNEKREEFLRIAVDGKEEFFAQDIITVDSEEQNLGKVLLLKNVTGFKILDEQKSGFVATVSHELRTPLSAINMSLLLLEDPRLQSNKEEQQKLMNTMKTEVKRLLRIVNELLLLSKTTTPNSSFNFEKIRIEQLFDAALTPTLLQFEEKKIQFSYSFLPDTPEFNADLGKLSWVLINLLNNAVKFTPENGKVELLSNFDSEHVYLKVKDSGIGIAPQFQEKIFEKFFQIPQPESSQPGGAGLGLSIAKEIILAHKGTIQVVSEPGKGTEFIITLPIVI